jgi:hydroxymethylglutaryl-CoA lyase
MGFGNPYGDPWDVEIVEIGLKIIENGVKILSLSDTVGNSTLT